MPFGNIGATVHQITGDRCTEIGATGPLLEAIKLGYATKTGVWRNDTHPAVELCQSTLDTTPEDRFSPAPIAERGGVRLAADVRLDNRDELAATLGLPNATTSDEAFVLAAYERWGIDCAGHLDGDFAFVLWDGARAQLFAARDLFGMRSLYYAHDGGDIVIASSIKAVLAGLRQPPKLDLDFLRALTNRRAIGTSATPYRSVRRVEAGHRLIVTRAGAEYSRYAELQPQPAPKNAKEAFDGFRSHLTRAVEVRLRSATPVGFLLSGGFDSSVIVMLANRAVAQGRSQATLRTYSATYKRIREGDEREYLQAVLDQCAHVTPTLLPSDDELWSLELLDSGDGFECDEPPLSSRFSWCGTGRPAVADGCRVLVAGTGGDELVYRSPYRVGELFWEMSGPAMLREARYFLKKSPMALVRGGCLALLDKLSSQASGPIRSQQSVLSKRARARFGGSRRALRRDYVNSVTRWVGIEMRVPFVDRRLVEFVMGLPPEYLFLGGQVKRLLREPFGDLLPQIFRDRRTFAHSLPQVLTGMSREVPAMKKLLAAPLLLELGLVTRRQLSLALDGTARQDVRSIDPITTLLATETWLQRTLLGQRRHL